VKSLLKKYIFPLYLRSVLFMLLAAVAIGFVFSFFFPHLSVIPRLLLLVTAVLFVADYIMLFSRNALFARRITPERMSNGDENAIRIYIQNAYPFPVNAGTIDEIPYQFQLRDVWFDTRLQPGEEKQISYSLRPVKRGEYEFGSVNVFARSYLGIIMRRYVFDEQKMVPVYPSFLQMRRYQLMAISNRLNEIGVKKIRRIGHSMEFEQIKEYVQGDDIRTINWKATARKSQLMVNGYTDEKSQQIYCLVDKSRVMKMPFNGLSLLDYAINASLVLSNVALVKQDKAGLITFSEEPGSFLAANRKATQMNTILEVLYKQKTRYLESDYDKLYTLIRSRITQRSLLVLFTNFESMPGLKRQIKYLRKMAQQHLLMVVFFENTELFSIVNKPAVGMEDIYTRTIAEKFVYEKKMIVKELQKYGIIAILTPPEQVTVNSVNKYLELKSRQLI
jgi:uncharacterized protein (DUF58 family)